MKRVLIILLLLPCILLCNAQSSNTSRKKGQKVTRNVVQPQNVVSIEQIAQKLDFLFDATFDATHPAITYDSTRVAVTEYTKSQDTTTVKKIQDHYYESFYNASESEQLDSAIICAFKYLMIDGKKDEKIIWSFLIDNYGCDGDTESTMFLINMFNEVSVLRDNVYTETIELLTAKYDDVIHPVSFDDIAEGYWISLDRNENETVNFFGKEFVINGTKKVGAEYIFQITDVKDETGATMLLSPTYSWKAKKTGTYWYNYPSTENYMLRNCQSLFCDADAKFLKLVFGTEKVRGGNTERARQELANNRQWKADMHGKINSSDMGFGEQLGAVAFTEVAGGLLDALAISMGAGSKTAEAYEVKMSANSPKTMNADITYRRVKASSYGYTSLKDYKPNQKYEFVKWEESDSVIFISAQGKPIFMGTSLSKDSPLLDEYKAIKKKYNFWRPQCSIPSFASIGVGALCIAMGAKKIADYGSNNKRLSEKEKNKRVAKAAALISVGVTIPCVTIAILNQYLVTNKRISLYKIHNKQGMDKMRKKAAEIQVAPVVNPFDNSMEIGASINF